MATLQHDPHNPAPDGHGDGHGGAPAPDTSRGYEYVDLRLKGIIVFVVAMVAAMIVIQFMVYGLMDVFHANDARQDKAPSPLLARGPDGQPVRQDPPGPLLQPFSPEHSNMEPTDFANLRRENQRLLETYGVAPSDPSLVRIPIERAMELVAKNGLPVAPPATRPARASVTLNLGAGQ